MFSYDLFYHVLNCFFIVKPGNITFYILFYRYRGQNFRLVIDLDQLSSDRYAVVADQFFVNRYIVFLQDGNNILLQLLADFMLLVITVHDIDCQKNIQNKKKTDQKPLKSGPFQKLHLPVFKKCHWLV
ncbi:hypothetical protein SDC9_189921 [bioreactor metagenome]|uniref:Uncharacterized protein n=1 Tax=bioreactor metagenome TaxID=1076179 RepID=A0A645I1N1_9ZZZZ